jgi:hypothetical protein
MAMQVAQTASAPSSETAARAYNSNLQLTKRDAETTKRGPAVRVASRVVEVPGYAPNPYTLLISRIENAALQGQTERAAIAQLAQLLAERVPTLSEKARRQIAELEEFKVTGISTLSRLPMEAQGRLTSAGQSPALLNLLKQPLFVSYIKDSQRAALYGPRGILLAS